MTLYNFPERAERLAESLTKVMECTYAIDEVREAISLLRILSRAQLNLSGDFYAIPMMAVVEEKYITPTITYVMAPATSPSSLDEAALMNLDMAIKQQKSWTLPPDDSDTFEVRSMEDDLRGINLFRAINQHWKHKE